MLYTTWLLKRLLPSLAFKVIFTFTLKLFWVTIQRKSRPPVYKGVNWVLYYSPYLPLPSKAKLYYPHPKSTLDKKSTAILFLFAWKLFIGDWEYNNSLKRTNIKKARNAQQNFSVNCPKNDGVARGPIRHLCLKRNYAPQCREKDSACRVRGTDPMSIIQLRRRQPGRRKCLGGKNGDRIYCGLVWCNFGRTEQAAKTLWAA